jgi:hypothetical protein
MAFRWKPVHELTKKILGTYHLFNIIAPNEPHYKEVLDL